MCGIAGYCTTKNQFVDKTILIKMRDTLSHRGPDDKGIYISPDKYVGLAHRRLSIIDLSERGHQPMSNEDRTVWITYNGEIYNFQEIKQDLEKKGHVFKNNSDTEVIIHAYEEFGNSCLNYFNGMFAFAIYDFKKKEVFLARDRFGIKPLYYFFKDGLFGFASEIKSLLLLPNFTKEINYGAVGDFFKYRYIPAPRSIWNNIHKLPHGHYASFDIFNNNLTIKQYYSLDEKILHSKGSTIEEVNHLLFHSVKKRLISDVEVGTLLSGGIDSSSVSAIAAGFHSNIKSFSVGFEPDEYSELPYSKVAADFFKTDHITKTINDIDDNLIDRLSFFYDEPLADSSCVPTYLLCQMVSKHVKVALSGDGGDEVFAGYKWYDNYLNDFNLSKNNALFNAVVFIKKFFGKKHPDLSHFENYYNKLLLNRFDDGKFKDFFTPDIYKLVMNENHNLFNRYIKSSVNGVRAVQYVDINTFMVDDILTKVDRASMAHSLEVRVPLLDYQLVEAVFSLSEKDFPSVSTGKPVLKKIMHGRLPEQILNREKKGFSAPLASWKGFQDIGSLILNGTSLKDGLFQKKFIENLIDNKYPNSNAMLWMIFIFEKWYQKWF